MAKLRFLIISALMLASTAGALAQNIVRKSERTAERDSIERVIVAGDTVDIILPERNFGRFDRGLFNYIFIPKGKWGFGITASYGELQTEDISVLSLLKDLNFKGKIYSVKPYISYFVRSNQAVGLKLDYSRGIADLGKLAIDFDEDLNFSLRDVSYYQQSLAASFFYRNYVGLDHNGRFGIFNEVEPRIRQRLIALQTHIQLRTARHQDHIHPRLAQLQSGRVRVYSGLCVVQRVVRCFRPQMAPRAPVDRRHRRRQPHNIGRQLQIQHLQH